MKEGGRIEEIDRHRGSTVSTDGAGPNINCGCSFMTEGTRMSVSDHVLSLPSNESLRSPCNVFLLCFDNSYADVEDGVELKIRPVFSCSDVF